MGGRAAEANYRADIDGLRALAVVAVLLSHLNVGWLGGGYVGVDVFFVISGYVVFGDLRRRAATGSLSIGSFYLRRARRLLPNLIATCTAVLLVGAFVFLPSDFLRLPGRVAASVLGFSNWLFAFQSGYFMPASEWNPLLHTWTLSVEFQFYLLVPLLVIAVARLGERTLRPLVVLLGIASFGYTLLTGDELSNWHFFDSIARAWEFLLGIGLHLFRVPRLNRALAEGLCTSALVALGASFVLFDRNGAFPDARALVPTSAIAVLIASLQATATVRQALCWPGAVLIGRASYSIYLWHWPFIVFAGYLWPGHTESLWFPILLLPPIVAVSLVMYRVVEKPMRAPTRVTERTFIFGLLAGGGLLAALSGAILATSGWVGRFDDRILALDREASHISAKRARCHRSELGRALDQSCIYGAGAAPTLAVWSDSHAVELIDNLAPGLASRGLSAVLFSYSSCPPRRPIDVDTSCDRFNAKVLAALLESPDIKTVILAGALDTARYRENRKWSVEFSAAARALLRGGKRLIIIYPVPNQPFHVPRAMANELRFGIDYEGARTTRKEYLARTRDVFEVYDQLVSDRVTRVYPHLVLCPGDRCLVSDGQAPFYFDDNHLSMRGARLVADQTLLTL